MLFRERAPDWPAMRPLALSLAVLALAGCGSGAPAPGGDWPLPNGDLRSTRAASESGIDRDSVGRLEPVWRFRIRARGESGGMTATPVVAGANVYLLDMQSNVFALDLERGVVRWRHRVDFST